MRTKFILGLPLLLLLSGCNMGHGRNFNTSAVEKEIVDGKTTKAEVIQMLGTPMSKSRTGQSEMWQYQFYRGGYLTPVGVFGKSGDIKSAMIVFEGDVVKSHTTSETETPE